MASVQPAQATIQVSNLVYAWYDDPEDTEGPLFGLPFDGSTINYDPGSTILGIPPNRYPFEYNAVASDPSGFTADDEIIVGRGGPGEVLIAGSSTLRAEDLIIGDRALVGSLLKGGTGTVRITGFASTYNNDPAITALHPSVILPVPPDGTPWPGTIRSEDTGNSLILGRGEGSTGLLELIAGGSAEIQAGVIIAPDPHSTGEIKIDGFDSSLTSGGFEGGAVGDVHILVVGPRGTGTMRILNGGTVVSEAVPSGGGTTTEINFGATIGALPATSSEPGIPGEEGGQGTVTVSGASSDWIIGGSLQIGGFHNNILGGIGTIGDPEGDEAIYNSNPGTGTLIVDTGGLVRIRHAIGANPGQDVLALVIGRLGTLQLNEGYVTVGDQADRIAGATVMLVNDGAITGSGRIDTGSFRNRLLGEVRVTEGQKLTVAATAELDEMSMTPIDPLINYGLIEVIGTAEQRAEIEFLRGPGDLNTAPPPERFINRLVIAPATPGVEFNGGVINAQHATLRFGTGIFNEGTIGFTVGTNIVKGALINRVQVAPAPVPGFGGRVIFGEDTTTVFEDELVLLGTNPPIPASAQLIFLDNGFTAVGLNMGISLSNPSPINAAGDIALSGPINLTLESDVQADLAMFGPSQTYTLISFGGEAYFPTFNDEFGVWEPDYSAPLPDCSVVAGPCGLFTTIMPDVSTLGPAFVDMLPVTQRIGQAIVLAFVDLASIGVTLAGDYNDDGKVDAADYIVWSKNEGTTNLLPNDPFGGTIGSNQYAAWRANFGSMAMPGGGSGGGLGGAVPEPTGLAMLVSGSLLALAFRRQHRPCPLTGRSDTLPLAA